MKVTVVTLQDDDLVESYVGCVQGAVSEDQRRWLASQYKAEYDRDVPVDDEREDLRVMSFREVFVVPSVGDLRELLAISDEGMDGIQTMPGTPSS